MFTITRDLICDDSCPSRVGTTIDEMPLYGIERVMGVDPTVATATERVKFRLFDDDGELYYEGELDDDDDCENQSAALRWGEADAGCTYIEVLRDGKWVQEIA